MIDALLVSAGERATPVLVKEVRSALRGKWFKFAFGITLLAAVVATVGFAAWAIASGEAGNGIAYASLLFACLTLGSHLVLPFSALLSMQAESDEHTLEMLQLSHLAPWRIVLGKVTAVLVQSTVLYGAFLPFFATAILLRGVEPHVVVLGFVVSFVYGAALCSVAAFFGTFGRSRMMRVLAMVGFGLFLLQSAQMAALFTFIAFGGGVFLGGPGGAFVASFTTTLVILYAAALAFAFACARIAHEEENRSTPMRLVASTTMLVGIVWALVVSDPIASVVPLATATAFVVLPAALAASESERLPRAVRVPSSRAGAILAAPWLPGGGLGVLFLLVHLGLPVVVLAAIEIAHGSRPSAAAGLAVWCVFGATYVLAPCAVFLPFAKTPAHRGMVRGSVLAFVGASLALGGIVSALRVTSGLGSSAEQVARALLPWELASAVGKGEARLPLACVLIVFTLAVLANAPRAVRAIGNVAVRSRGAAARAAGIES